MSASSSPSVESLINAMHECELTMRDSQSGTLTSAPMTTVPNPVPRATFMSVLRVMPLFNQLVDTIAHDFDYLVNHVGPSDMFSAKLADIVKEVYMTAPSSSSSSSSSDGATHNKKRYQTAMLGLLRSDYLFDIAFETRNTGSSSSSSNDHGDDVAPQEKKEDEAEEEELTKKAFGRLNIPMNTGWKQVEINTIASSFPALSSRCTSAMSKVYPEKHIACSTAERDIVCGLERAHRFFLESYPEQVARCRHKPQQQKQKHGGVAAPCVVFVVQQGERNVGDQGLLRRGLEALGVRVVRKSLLDLGEDLRLDPETGHALLTIVREDVDAPTSPATGLKRETDFEPEELAEIPVSVFYFRGLYDWKEYEAHPRSWDIRLKMEKSMAIKCPSVPYHLCTWKTIQMQLFRDDALLKRFVPDPDEFAVLRSFMVGHYALNDFRTSEKTQSLIRDAVEKPHNWVVKSLREGWGFILEGEKMKEQLEKLLPSLVGGGGGGREEEEKEELNQFVSTHLLVYRINSRGRTGGILRNGTTVTEFTDLEGELGTYGAILSDWNPQQKIHYNVESGYLLRTKSKSNLGGGIMSGVAALDAVELT